eukprot:GHVU01225786.1.p2 GENE.GHVU01225786.1~~GHVU01225786.1.p2  ORF type:complete len:108 (-),score=10.19 GHVU01225786.1:636-959(-)
MHKPYGLRYSKYKELTSVCNEKLQLFKKDECLLRQLQEDIKTQELIVGQEKERLEAVKAQLSLERERLVSETTHLYGKAHLTMDLPTQMLDVHRGHQYRAAAIRRVR